MHKIRQIQTASDNYKFGFHYDDKPVFKAPKGLSEDIVKLISNKKEEPEWMLNRRLSGYKVFKDKPMPTWGADLSGIKFDDIYYYVRPVDEQGKTWDDVPQEIKETFERLGIPEAERAFLAGVKAQYDSEVIYGSIEKQLKDQGVVFLDTDSGLKQYPELFKKYFGTVIPFTDNKFAALNTAVWSGGSFLYVPKGVKVKMPLQAYFRINAERMGQFERTLIIADEGSEVHYVEGCTAPTYSSGSLHSAVVEIIAMEGARVRYTTIQNWSTNVYNLVTKRAIAKKNATVEWIDCNLGSQVTMKYPSVIMQEEGAHGEVLSIAVAGKGQHQDAGAKMIHVAPNTSSIITSKSICKDGGRTSYRGKVHILKKATNVKSNVECDALIFDNESQTDTYPTNIVENPEVELGHEASVSKISEDQLFYLMSRGISEAEASALIVAGFIEPVAKELPMEYAIELNRLIEMEMEGSVG